MNAISWPIEHPTVTERVDVSKAFEKQTQSDMLYAVINRHIEGSDKETMPVVIAIPRNKLDEFAATHTYHCMNDKKHPRFIVNP